MSSEAGESVTVQRWVAPEAAPDEGDTAPGGDERGDTLRPQSFADYPGRQAAKEHLKVYVQSARLRGDGLDHVLLYGPPGLGKTTLAHIIARELAAPFVGIAAPALDKPGDLVGVLLGLEPGSVLFLDEVHRLPVVVEESLYSAMEDFRLELVVGQGQSARSVTMPTPRFTLIGATTKPALLSRPFRNRFGIQERLEYYDVSSLAEIVARQARVLAIPLAAGAAEVLARSSRGTPRIAGRLLRRIWDFAVVSGAEQVDEAVIASALARLQIDRHGLDRSDRKILRVIAEDYDGGPVGAETLAVSVGEERATIEDVLEPFLIHLGALKRTPRGRALTAKGYELVRQGEPEP